LLLSLPARLRRIADAIAVVTPSYAPRSLSLVSQLEPLRIGFVHISPAESLRVDVTDLFADVPAPVPVPRLTPEQERDCHVWGYKCRMLIHIAGDITPSGNNVVHVGSSQVEVGDAPFLLFLRLLLELRRRKQGDVAKVKLQREGYLSEDGEFQSIKRLRDCFVRASGDLDPKDLIENCQPKALRLSMHPDLITCDLDRLSVHNDSGVRKLVEALASIGHDAS
jgi:hypothetical protein